MKTRNLVQRSKYLSMSRFTIILCFLLAFVGLKAQNRAIIDKVAAYVGDELVLLSEVEEQFQLMRDRQPDLDPEQKCAILENLMVQKLLVNQAKLDSVEVSDEEIEQQLDARIDPHTFDDE